MKIASALVLSALVGIPTSAFAQNCNALLDTTISPMTFEAAAQALQSTPLVKDEFETTAQYQARVAAAQQGIPSTISLGIDLHKDSIVYDADQQRFVISARAFGSEYGIDWFSAFYDTPVRPEGYSLGSTVLGIAVSSNEEPTGVRKAQNAYGATWDVVEIDRRVDAVYDSVAARYDVKLFGRGISSDFKWNFPVPSESARAFKDSLRGAFVMAPRAPFYLENTQGTGGRITIQNPRDITQHARVIMADIQCAVLTNADGYVLMAITTN